VGRGGTYEGEGFLGTTVAGRLSAAPMM